MAPAVYVGRSGSPPSVRGDADALEGSERFHWAAMVAANQRDAAEPSSVFLELRAEAEARAATEQFKCNDFATLLSSV